MGRPKTDNPKVALTLRLRPELIARYTAVGGDLRETLVQVLEAGPPEAVKAEPVVRPAAAPVGRAFGPVRAAPGSRLKKR